MSNIQTELEQRTAQYRTEGLPAIETVRRLRQEFGFGMAEAKAAIVYYDAGGKAAYNAQCEAVAERFKAIRMRWKRRFGAKDD